MNNGALGFPTGAPLASLGTLVPPWVPGGYYAPAFGGGGFSTGAATSGDMYIWPFVLPPGVYDALGVEVFTVGASSFVRAGMWLCDDKGWPSELWGETGQLQSSSGTGIKESAIPRLELAQATLVHCGAVSQAGTPPVLLSQTNMARFYPARSIFQTSGAAYNAGMLKMTGVTGDLPHRFPTPYEAVALGTISVATSTGAAPYVKAATA